MYNVNNVPVKDLVKRGISVKINGFQKMTLLDYPGKVACTVFTGGCNFRCPFCHNAALVEGLGDEISENEVFAFLEKRKGLLDGVCITGGEPLLQPDIAEFISKVREMGYAVKLDTNGSFPLRLKELAKQGLIDYAAMDVKNCPEKYSITAGCEHISFSDVEESIDFLINGSISYEFRTTVVKEFHTVSDIEKLAESIKGAKRYFLQYFADSGSLLSEGLHPADKETMEKMRSAALLHVSSAEIRGG